MAAIGQRNTLPVLRETSSGLYLDGGPLGEILLPGRYIPRGAPPRKRLDVFIYRDSEDRLVATTETPLAMVGEFACLNVKEVNPQVGAFLDWGLPKDLLLPFREQLGPVHPGQALVVAVCLDARTGRIIASARLHRHLSREKPAYRDGQAVAILITGPTPLGYNAIVENRHRGLLYQYQRPVPLAIGQRLQAFIRTVRAGGKIDLSLDASGYQRVASLTEHIVRALGANGGRLDFDDDSSPEAVRQTFSVSKKAFKQALGKLYRDRRITFDRPGIRLLDNPTGSSRT